jgi:hypothetical protein
MTDRGPSSVFWVQPVESGEGRGALWPEGDTDPARTELVAYDVEIDRWMGDDLVAAIPPWVLMSPDLVEAVQNNGFTGLRFGAEASLRVPPDTSSNRTIGSFRIVVPESQVDLRKHGGRPEDGVSVGDTIECSGWNGADFSYSATWLGIVVSGRAMDLLRTFRLVHATVRQVGLVDPSRDI